MLLFLGKSVCIPLFIIIAILFFVADVLRLKNQHVQNIYNIFFDVVTRNSEKNRMTGASYVFLSIVLVTLLFDVKIAVVSLLIMSLADPVASLVGRAFGKFRFLGKTLEGSISFFIVASIILLAFNFPTGVVLYVSIFCTLVELLSNKIQVDDNLLIPLSSALLLFIF